ncbi:unnamed protein product [Brassica oleracea]
MKTFSIIDLDLKIHPSIDSYCSGCTALTAILQGDHLVVANAGDSRAVIATTSDDGVGLVPVQLSVDFKPNIPEEAERIKQSDGRLFCLDDEPGVYRVGMPNGRSLGLAVSRAFGDYCLKDFGLVSEPEVSYRKITSKDQFLILATDGMWDVMTNDEAVEIVRGVKDRRKSAERLTSGTPQRSPHRHQSAVVQQIQERLMSVLRSTCKKWNTLTKDEGFIKKHPRFNSNSWKVVDGYYHRGVSLKVNTYWFAEEKLSLVPRTEMSDLLMASVILSFLLCFDFTKEKFGPRLPLPFHSFDDIVTISSVREEQLALLFQEEGLPPLPHTVKIWISSKIEPDAMSWNKLFLSVDTIPLTGFPFHYSGESFFVDEEEEVAVVLDEARDEVGRITRNTACIIGRNGHFKQVDLGGVVHPSLSLPADACRSPPVFVCSYVPSSVKIM